jgi:hypothetical protein
MRLAAKIFFWFQPVETDIIRGVSRSPRPRDERLDIVMCRQQIDRFITAILHGSLSRDDGHVGVALRVLR